MFPLAHIYCVFRGLISVDSIERSIVIYVAVIFITYVDIIILGIRIGLISGQDHDLIIRLITAGAIVSLALLLFMAFYMSKERDAEIMKKYASFSKGKRSMYEALMIVQVLITFVGLAAMLLTV
jgi:hypothetical protein